MKVRLNKYIASAGFCSRREADRLIEAGKVTVNGEKAHMGAQVSVGPPKEDEVVVNGRRVVNEDFRKVVLAFYKPIGVTCTERDRYAQKTISDVLKYPVRLTYAGRLDKDSEGLLLMTNDGQLINEMMRGSHGHEKEYMVKVDKEITGEFIHKMEAGIFLEELNITTKPCVVKGRGKHTFSIILTQGVNKQIRRMCKELGFQVINLKRNRVVNIQLAKLKPGEFRELTEEELQVLYDACGVSR